MELGAVHVAQQAFCDGRHCWLGPLRATIAFMTRDKRYGLFRRPGRAAEAS
jgi:hypothetical protein